MIKIGDKIVCKDPGRDINLMKNKVYTAALLFKDNQGSPTVELEEVRAPYPFIGFLLERFRKALPEDLKQLETKEKITV